MNIYPKNVVELMDLFPTEEACLEYLSLIRWPDGYVCMRCDGKDVCKMSSGLYRCQTCRYAGSVISGTLFQDTHKPLRLWFQAIWYVVSQKNGVSALGLQKALGLGSYHTAWEWLHKLRRAMVRPGRDKLSGIVEVNETMIGGEHAGTRGRGAGGKTLVLIAAEDTGGGIGRIRLSTISDASGGVLTDTIQKMVSLGSTIRTDGWSGYSGLSSNGYTHLSISNNNVKETDAIQIAHRVASLLKRWLVGTHHGAINHKNLPYYLDEFTFRFNRRTSTSRGKLFLRLIQQALEIDPVPAKSLNTICSG
ncbi:IS1595 family transposase (plasmid) [Legionella antarctica]|uniref:IS1595 family transposase n=1 Tax=Legionella antarctica TaxID=2708020 RepID=A0A6F8T845_9GAMM|nr:IS1595 family transposase [Legionella antarctica]BCA93644.1 IS1595 family transposase [Legionella antarctica]BCA93731.1 IS1595 family transposase [Legionella antarctica]BCA94106.1 IS1595 family transposase [Legionella antarctica]BCA95502.1 IS1595 family transposase [Legionella antarctica]BCA96621.1 IS1595 family transposase [Legionella antarctica]